MPEDSPRWSSKLISSSQKAMEEISPSAVWNAGVVTAAPIKKLMLNLKRGSKHVDAARSTSRVRQSRDHQRNCRGW